jgi:hypothetical protein
MKKLMVSVFALTMMATGAMAGERLTTSQLDQVSAGFVIQTNVNLTRQIAFASARASNFCAFAKCKSGGAVAVASNSNVTGQANVN